MTIGTAADPDCSKIARVLMGVRPPAPMGQNRGKKGPWSEVTMVSVAV